MSGEIQWVTHNRPSPYMGPTNISILTSSLASTCAPFSNKFAAISSYEFLAAQRRAVCLCYKKNDKILKALIGFISTEILQ
jgi:hypothetical protein